jgi:translation initiation factor IF-3
MTRVNHKIRVPEVRLVDFDGSQVGVVPTSEALALARKRELDLVEVSATARPPVCRVMDYGKYKYELGKKEKGKKSGQTRVKEIKFHANVGEHDYQTKLRRGLEFLEQGHRIKCSLYFRGRENDHREFGFDVLNRVIEDLKEKATVDQLPRMLGRNLVMLLSPIKTGGGSGRKKEEKTKEKASAGESRA